MANAPSSRPDAPDAGGSAEATPRVQPSVVQPSSSSPSGVMAIAQTDPASKGTSLRLRLLQTILPAVLVPLVITGLLGYRLVQSRTEARVQEQLKNQALLTSESTTEVLDNLLNLPRTIASSPLVINEAQAGSQQVDREGLDEQSTEALEKQFADTKLLRVHNRLNTYLQETATAAGISDISVTERHGYNVAYSKPATDFVQSDESWWKNGRTDGQWISSPDFNFAAKAYTVELAQAISEPGTGDFLGVVRAVLPTRKFSLLSQYIQRTGISGSQRVQLVDGARLKVIDTISPQGFRKNTDIIGDKPVETFISAFMDAFPEAKSSQGLLTTLQNVGTVKNLDIDFADDTTTVVSFTHKGRQYKAANIPGTEWVAIASMNSSEISALGRNPLLPISGSILLLAALTSGVILWIAQQLTTPLDSLANQAELVAAGDFDTLLPPRGTRETRALTESFNQLVVKVKDLLNQQTAETAKAQLFGSITAAPANTLTDIKPIVDQSLPTAQALLEADRVVFYPIQFSQLAAEAVRPNLPKALSTPNPETTIAPSLRQGGIKAPVMAVNNTANADLDATHRKQLDALVAKATLTAPIFNEDQLFGFLVAHKKQPHDWQPSETQFLGQLAAQLKLVIDRVTAIKIAQDSRQMAQVSRQQVDALTSENRQQLEAQALQQAQLQSQVDALTRDIQGAARGDLTVRAQSTGQALTTVADVFNLTVASLQDLVNQVKASSTQVNTFLQQNAATASQLSNTTNTQTQEAVRTLSTLQAMAQSMKAIAADAQQAAITAKQLNTTFATGETGLGLTAQRVVQLQDVCNAAVKQLESFNRAGEHIAQGNSLLYEIAEQMDGLAKQAGAANPADAGQQLEKVSQRAASLANQTLEETKLMDTFLQSLEKRTAQMASAIEQISTEVSESQKLVSSSQQTFSEAAGTVKQFDQLAASISAATQDQSQISDSVTLLVQQVAELSEQTANFSKQMENALFETAETAQSLQDSVSRFKVDA